MKKINTDNLDSFFSFISKAIIVIPIFILIISLFLKFSSPKNSVTTLNSRLTPTEIPISQNNSFKFDLKGPIVCDDLFIKDKKVLLKNKLINYLLNGDCLYIWEEGKINGKKKCGLTNYVNMAENYLGFFNINDLINNNLVKDSVKDQNIYLTNVVKSCKKGEIKNNFIFEVPLKVLFSNKK
ncbi:MAG: hypothetical protein UR23_C0037G0012 [Candidatus Roizmanbacteria bacterium GW2011_GWA2_32_13]|uniref:Uncharacterized protein n=1 Tax=Candidatus Roizmanbacteria bacterium GW2011_GWA2_32_13 TaxID=1618475 RepID=A0A0F9Z721_9BACT|nr:MAG: hypothetical protein UR23_C0037G0012 [Candidatus Roizmanbacteria bacterium GW2011_GWA2_32_13]